MFFIVVALILASQAASAFVAGLAARGLLYTTEIVAAIEGRAILRQGLSATVASVRSAALKKSMNERVALLVTGSTSPTAVQSVLGVASWASIGSTLTNTLDAYFLGETGLTGMVPASESNSEVSPYKLYVGAGSGGTAPYLYGNDATLLFYAAYRYRVANSLLSCPSSAGCTYSDTIEITTVTDSSSSNGTVGVTGKYQTTYQTSGGTPRTVDATLSLTIRTNTAYEATSTNVGTDILTVTELEQQELDYQKLADVINALVADAVSAPDYEGLQVTQADYATAEDVKTALKTAGITSPTQALWAEPWVDLDTTVQPGTGTTQPGTTTPETGTEVSYDDPKITEPTLETPPTGIQILSPIFSMFDNNWFNMSSISASCPVWSFTVFEREITIDSHCSLLEKIRGIISALMLVLYGFCAWRIVMSA